LKVLVFSQQLVVGGSLVNAIELSAALRDLHGCDVVLFATTGPLVKLVEEKRLRFLPAPEPCSVPSPARAHALREAVRLENPDLIHVWDCWQCLDAYYIEHVLMRFPMLVTDMMMHVTRLLPKELPTTFGTPELVDRARAAGRRRVDLLVPPIDVQMNAPSAVEAEPFRKRYGLAEGDATLVTVSRLAEQMKGESLSRTIDVVRTLGRYFPLRFVVVGDGGARGRLEHLADQVNAELKRRAIVFTGPLLDPRPAYATADIVIGMGGSALRGMAFGKPVVIVGENGFSSVLTPETAPSHYYKGIYGRGDGDTTNRRLVADIRRLIEDPRLRTDLGQFSREFVVQKFSLETVSSRCAEFCRRAAIELPPFRIAVADGARTAALYLRERRFQWRW
jgi:glycosyltransferase involved in cell wall biosynthesis